MSTAVVSCVIGSVIRAQLVNKKTQERDIWQHSNNELKKQIDSITDREVES